jgi:hypothetical protein
VNVPVVEAASTVHTIAVVLSLVTLCPSVHSESTIHAVPPVRTYSTLQCQSALRPPDPVLAWRTR